jgi:hypothetical protein
MNVLREKTSGELFASDDLNLVKPLRAVSSPRVQDLFAPESLGNSLHGLADYDTPSSRARGGQKWQLTWKIPELRPRGCKVQIHTVYATFVGAHLPVAPREPANAGPLACGRSDLWRAGPSTRPNVVVAAQRVFFVLCRCCPRLLARPWRIIRRRNRQMRRR